MCLPFTQYVGIVGDAYLAQSNPELASQFKALGAASGASRKYWRLGRFVYEYNAIVKLTKESSMSPFDKLLAYTAKMSWGYYWFWDNITYLSKLGVLKHDKATINKMAIESARGWLYGCGVEMLKLAILLAAEYRKLKNLQKALKSSNVRSKPFPRKCCSMFLYSGE